MNEDISKRVLTNLLKRWDKNKTQSHPSSTALTAAEHVSLKVCNIVLKYSHNWFRYENISEQYCKPLEKHVLL